MLALAKHAQRTQQRVCNIFVISHERREGWSRFLHGDKYHPTLKIDTVNFGGRGQSCPKHSKWVFKVVAISQERRDEVDFWCRKISQFSIS